jgi:glycosyltransferase involved in cell wall biosynthesis
MAGAGVYTYQLVRALAALPGEQRLSVFARPGLFDDLAQENERFRVVHTKPSGRAGRLAWEQAILPLLLRRLRIDVLHSPHHHTPVAAIGVRRVVTFHDVTFLRLPERYTTERRLYMEGVTRAAARVARAIITPSQTVQDDVVRRLGVERERVVAIYEAAGPQYRPMAEEDVGRVRWRYQLPNEYVLSVGSLEPGKNRARLFRAYALLRAQGIESQLVIAGQPAWRYEGDEELVRTLGLSEHVRFLGYVPDEDLPALYTGAAVSAFPSLYEGFGLPVLESMACGTPVVCSDVSATAEVASDAALLVDPRDIGAIANALRRVLSDPWLRSDLRARGLARAQEFSWDRAARDTLAVYQIVAAQR